MKLIYNGGSADTIGLSTNYSSHLPHKAVLSVGCWKKQVNVLFRDEIAPEQMLLSPKVFGNFLLPDRLDYSFQMKGRVLMLGPVIGFLAISREKECSEENLNRKLAYFYRYLEIGGLVFVCQSDSFDFASDTVDGYAYISTDKEGKGIWEKGTFPLPGAIYKRVDLSQPTYDRLVLRMGDRIFNSYFFDKQQMYSYLCDCPKTNVYLPETIPFTDFAELEGLLEKHRLVYLKPLMQNKSKGIIAIRKEGGKTYRFCERNSPDRIHTHGEAEALIESLTHKERYILQQGIEMPLWEGRRYDFRVILQKDHSGKWECTSMYARFGAVGASVTNFTISGYGKKGREAIRMVFSMSEKEAFLLEKRMTCACKDICDRLDRTVGNYGDVGVDLVVDGNQRIWLLEVNKLHDHHFPLLADGDRQTYFEVVTKPFFYAKALAGF